MFKSKKKKEKQYRDTIAALVRQISLEISDERASKCAYDCLMQWDSGCLDETILAWQRYIQEFKDKSGHCETQRHGIWVPAIPL